MKEINQMKKLTLKEDVIEKQREKIKKLRLQRNLLKVAHDK